MPHKDPEKIKAFQKAYREKNREKLLADQKRYYQENREVLRKKQEEYRRENKELISEIGKRYYCANKEIIYEKRKEYRKQYYEINRERMLQKNKEYAKKNRERYTANLRNNRHKKADWLWELKSGLCCVLCGEKHPACLDFHHKDVAQKEALISALVRCAASLERIIVEMEKCDILCANCHRKFHCKRMFNGHHSSMVKLLSRFKLYSRQASYCAAG